MNYTKAKPEVRRSGTYLNPPHVNERDFVESSAVSGPHEALSRIKHHCDSDRHLDHQQRPAQDYQCTIR